MRRGSRHEPPKSMPTATVAGKRSLRTGGAGGCGERRRERTAQEMRATEWEVFTNKRMGRRGWERENKIGMDIYWNEKKSKRGFTVCDMRNKKKWRLLSLFWSVNYLIIDYSVGFFILICIIIYFWISLFQPQIKEETFKEKNTRNCWQFSVVVQLP